MEDGVRPCMMCGATPTRMLLKNRRDGDEYWFCSACEDDLNLFQTNRSAWEMKKLGLMLPQPPDKLAN